MCVYRCTLQTVTQNKFFSEGLQNKDLQGPQKVCHVKVRLEPVVCSSYFYSCRSDALIIAEGAFCSFGKTMWNVTESDSLSYLVKDYLV